MIEREIRELDLVLEGALGRVDRLVGAASAGALSFEATSTQDQGDLPTFLQQVASGFERLEETWAPRIAAARDALDGFFRRLDEDVRQLAVVRTGERDTPDVATWVGWSGDTRTVSVAVVPPAVLAEHRTALHRRVLGRLIRIRMLAATVGVVARIAPLVTNPATAALALPIAFQYILTMAGQWRELVEL